MCTSVVTLESVCNFSEARHRRQKHRPFYSPQKTQFMVRRTTTCCGWGWWTTHTGTNWSYARHEGKRAHGAVWVQLYSSSSSALDWDEGSTSSPGRSLYRLSWIRWPWQHFNTKVAWSCMGRGGTTPFLPRFLDFSTLKQYHPELRGRISNKTTVLEAGTAQHTRTEHYLNITFPPRKGLLLTQ
jgi:hypothetical protein